MVAVERIIEYIGINPEAPLAIANTEPPVGWPQNGEIIFRNVFLKYNAGAPYVLKNINTEIHAGEKVVACFLNRLI